MGALRALISIRNASTKDVAALYSLYEFIGRKDAGYFETVLERGCAIYIASENGTDCAFCIYNPTPKYSLYRTLGIPEIQDLNVVPAQRRKGIAQTLIRHCEVLAKNQGHEAVGISVGLFKDYGPAQRLYAKMGYMPDGNGVTYDRNGVTPYQSYPMDDDLCLMMIKTF